MPTSSPSLIISFTGLCLFVPREAPARDEVDVFLIRDSNHVAALFMRTSPGIDPCLYGFGPPLDVECVLDLTFVSPPSGPPVVLPLELADITAASGLRLDPSASSVVPSDVCIARVRLRGGSFTSFNKGPWNFNGKCGDLAFCVNWTIPNFVQVAELQTSLSRISAAAPALTLTADGNYRLLIVNVPNGEMPAPVPPAPVTINPNDSPPHFGMFAGLLTPGGLNEPTWQGGQYTVSSFCLGEPYKPPTLRYPLPGSFIRCMVAQASL